MRGALLVGMMAFADAVPAGVFLVVFVGIIALAVWASRREHQRRMQNLAALASRLGLEHKTSAAAWWSDEHVVEGRRDGRLVRFWSYTTGSGKSRRHWIAVGVAPRRAGNFEFRFEPQGIAARLAEWFGAKEVTVGDAAFDAAWFIRTNAPDVLRAALVPAIRERLMAARVAGATETFKLADGIVFYARQGRFADPVAVEQLESLLPVLQDLADVAEVGADAGGTG